MTLQPDLHHHRDLPEDHVSLTKIVDSYSVSTNQFNSSRVSTASRISSTAGRKGIPTTRLWRQMIS